MERDQDDEDLRLERQDIVRGMFVNTADDNYIVARWCITEGLDVDFSWLAVHTLEKYIKAVLLLNGRSVKNESHNISRLYQALQEVAPELLPDLLRKPGGLALDEWRDETPGRFVERLYGNGNPHNRYRVFGFVRFRDDLCKLDALVYSVRRLCVDLSLVPYRGRIPILGGVSMRDLLRLEPRRWSVSPTTRLERVAQGKRGEFLRAVLLNMNFDFAPDYDHQPIRMGIAAENSALTNAVISPLEREPQSRFGRRAARLARWAMENVKLHPHVEGQLKALCEKADGNPS